VIVVEAAASFWLVVGIGGLSVLVVEAVVMVYLFGRDGVSQPVGDGGVERE
jgi:hypothetical protein